MSTSIEVPLFLKSLQLLVDGIRDYQMNNLRTINHDFDRGFTTACKHVIDMLEKEEAEWREE